MDYSLMAFFSLLLREYKDKAIRLMNIIQFRVALTFISDLNSLLPLSESGCSVTYVSTLRTSGLITRHCSSLVGDLELGRWVHSIVSQSSHIKDLSIANSLIHMYTKCGEIQEALTIFGKLIDKNIVTLTYNTMILGLAAHGHVQEALDVFH
ncbi:pentatricopeptide repeat-containing protein [Tanacetum coccineum]